MSATAYFIWFIAMAVLVNLIIYGGITMTYLRDKRRGDPPSDVHATPGRQAHGLDSTTRGAPTYDRAA